ncbi:hypothetical protein BPAE_0158g00050 [Botrytis paeoniae]|uniref:Uncharacterized protein n=1 Tax=Botrytis paeoniae TaxID=278948 RepID=A0A4Z1FDM4_9HELO|nr:hypothetical protein BPAE_0158g00050 [Botrytis paeoniae]
MHDLLDGLENALSREYELPENLHFEFFLRRTHNIGEDALVGSVFDEGETVYAKVFDDEGIEFVCSGLFDNRWQAKERRGGL